MHATLTGVTWARRVAMGGVVVSLGFGDALVTADLPMVFDQNVVWVRQVADSETVLRASDEIAADAGWPHRTIEVSDPAVADALRPSLTAAGYDECRNVTMVLAGDPPAGRDDGDTAVVSIAEQRDLARRMLAEEPWASTATVLDQFAERERRLAEVTGGRAVVAPANEPVSRALVLFDGGLVEIDAVMTLSEHRGQGCSTAVMRRALREGAATGRPVVLVADAADWPLGWYERLGFHAAGVTSVFRRWPDKISASAR